MAISSKTLGYVVAVFLIAFAGAQTIETPPPPPQPVPTQQLEPTPQLEPMPRLEPMPELPAPMIQVEPLTNRMQDPGVGGSGGCSVTHSCEPERPHPPEQHLDKCKEYMRSHGYPDTNCDSRSIAPRAEGGTAGDYTTTAAHEAASRQIQPDQSEDYPSFLWYAVGFAIFLSALAAFRSRKKG